VPAGRENVFWTGGFRHKMNRMWSWCTKDAPEPMVDSVSVDILPSPDRKRHEPSEHLNCLNVNYGSGGGMTEYLCDNKDFYLACESPDKSTADIVVGFCLEHFAVNNLYLSLARKQMPSHLF